LSRKRPSPLAPLPEGEGVPFAIRHSLFLPLATRYSPLAKVCPHLGPLSQRERGKESSERRAVGVGAALVVQEDQLALTQGAVALNLIAVYRALGGGWKNGPLSSCRRWP
jgi:hypothetical protein